jgi:hypothetical protein
MRGVKPQNTAFDAKSKDALDACALHPAGRARVPGPTTTPDMAGCGVDLGGDDIGLHLCMSMRVRAWLIGYSIQHRRGSTALIYVKCSGAPVPDCPDAGEPSCP